MALILRLTFWWHVQQTKRIYKSFGLYWNYINHWLTLMMIVRCSLFFCLIARAHKLLTKGWKVCKQGSTLWNKIKFFVKFFVTNWNRSCHFGNFNGSRVAWKRSALKYLHRGSRFNDRVTLRAKCHFWVINVIISLFVSSPLVTRRNLYFKNVPYLSCCCP